MVKFSEHFKPKCAIMSLPIYKLHHLCPSLYLCWALSPADWFLPFLAPENQTNSCSLPSNDTHNDVTTDNAQHRSVPIDTFLDTDFAKRAKKLTEVDTNSEKCKIIFCPTHLKTYSLQYDHTLLAVMPVLCWSVDCQCAPNEGKVTMARSHVMQCPLYMDVDIGDIIPTICHSSDHYLEISDKTT